MPPVVSKVSLRCGTGEYLAIMREVHVNEDIDCEI